LLGDTLLHRSDPRRKPWPSITRCAPPCRRNAPGRTPASRPDPPAPRGGERIAEGPIEPIGNIPPAEAEARYYAQLKELAIAA
jgi:hypothetical protein